MSNVLPQSEKKAARRRMFAHFLLIGSIAFGAGACVAILSIVPAFLSVKIARAALDASQRDHAQGSVSEDQSAAVRAQGLITALQPIANASSSPTEALSLALAQKPAGLSITAITYTGGAKGTLALTGTADRREAVSAFRDGLEKTGRFSKVEVPVAAILGTQEGKFTITLSGI
ncbi:hypothetical protein A2765_02515 [Candidatus Kaiserbacteria bacterium RIFCSPHIGHO2_01_FULL_56_24]|uniref:Uncharacterized protein n=1 Tax=Candidatus Kaiserbacteria bacterium RIFCSPHIGHO2_01_FULL_56_24 TaxID=1798487 RepID=A0A1F6DAY5_9BACT|nr:MAG: hypothetical protein A2765_02515 [Candidatus Kaiserbacteria bacterium RIFCSPHIGHO2_01_FULL_56_24]